MKGYFYDGSFEGLLTAVFNLYETRTWPSGIVRKDTVQAGLFGGDEIRTDLSKARRVKQRISGICGSQGTRLLYKCLLSEKPDMEMLI